jgi:arabinogalactan endo-1,4-beta-galactosidase
MQIQLTFHYSDFWTDSKSQTLPLTWAAELNKLQDDTARFNRLRELVYDTTRQAMLAMQAQGTTPQFVSIGNEIEKGMLYPYGAASEANWPRLAALLRAGSSAVKSVAPQTRVVIHLDDAGNTAKYQDYFDHVQKLQVQWDVIGTSYYPFWSRRRIAEVMDFCSAMSTRYNRDVLIMETGFNWTPTRADGYAGQLSDNGPYPDSMSSPQGQAIFMRELLDAMKHTPRVLGLLYWDPVMIATPGVGWAVREVDDEAAENVVSNTTVFDFSGHALPILDSWRELNH